MKGFVALSLTLATSLAACAQSPAASTQSMANPWIELMSRAAAHAKQHGAPVPLLSPNDGTVVPVAGTSDSSPLVPVAQLQAMGVRVVPWTTNDPERMRAVIRTGVDGLISDRPDLLQKVVAEERLARPNDEKLKHFVVSAHRGGRGLRPENTLPSFESGLDQLATELETDTGVSRDGVSTIWHDQFYNPQSCRMSDGTSYDIAKRIYLRDIDSDLAGIKLVCDKLHFGDTQKNDLALSPVSVAFAKKEDMPSPYSPTYIGQLFKFVRFYADFYSKGAGKDMPHAAERAANARTVRFNIETKIHVDIALANESGLLPRSAKDDLQRNQTREPQAFVTILGGVITKEHMEDRCAIQSFDFRTLQLVEEQFPKIPTIYLTETAAGLSTVAVPAALRAPAPQ